MATVHIPVVSYGDPPGELAEAVRSAVDSVRAAGLDPVVHVAENHPTAALIDLPGMPVASVQAKRDNPGFGTAINELLDGVVSPDDRVLLVNPDTRTDRAAVTRLEATLVAHGEQVLVGAWLCRDGAVQVDATLLWFTSTGRKLRRSRWARTLQQAATAGTPVEVPRVCGGGMYLPGHAWLTLDGFDDTFWLYGEDVDLCLRARAHGYRSVADPAAVVAHDGTARHDRPSALVEQARADAALRLAARWKGPLRARLVAVELAAVTVAGMAVSSDLRAGRAGRLRSIRRWMTSWPVPSPVRPPDGPVT